MYPLVLAPVTHIGHQKVRKCGRTSHCFAILSVLAGPPCAVQVYNVGNIHVWQPNAPVLATLRYVYSSRYNGTITDVTHVLVADCNTLEGLDAIVQGLNHFVAVAPMRSRMALVYHSASPSAVVPAALQALTDVTAGLPEQASTLLQFVVLLRKALLKGGPALSLGVVQDILKAMDAAQGGEEEEDGVCVMCGNQGCA